MKFICKLIVCIMLCASMLPVELFAAKEKDTPAETGSKGKNNRASVECPKCKTQVRLPKEKKRIIKRRRRKKRKQEAKAIKLRCRKCGHRFEHGGKEDESKKEGKDKKAPEETAKDKKAPEEAPADNAPGEESSEE